MKRTVIVLALVAGCATTQAPAPMKGADSAGDPVTSEHTDPDRTDKNAKKMQPQSQATPVTPSATGTIARAELAKVLDKSPAYFLQNVQTEPRFAHGRFVGWRVVSFFPGDARFAGVDLQAGDVVTRVNGKAVEQPDQFMAVWTELRTSNELVVDVERAGARRTLRWTIADK